MSVSRGRVTVRMPEELLNDVDECYDERGFDDWSGFIRKAIRDAIMSNEALVSETHSNPSERRVTVRMSESLIETIEKHCDENEFRSRSEFIRKAVHDAVIADDPFTPQAREQINEARETGTDEESMSIEAVCEELEIDLDN